MALPLLSPTVLPQSLAHASPPASLESQHQRLCRDRHPLECRDEQSLFWPLYRLAAFEVLRFSVGQLMKGQNRGLILPLEYPDRLHLVLEAFSQGPHQDPHPDQDLLRHHRQSRRGSEALDSLRNMSIS